MELNHYKDFTIMTVKPDVFNYKEALPFVLAAFDFLAKSGVKMSAREWAEKLGIKHAPLLVDVQKGRRAVPVVMGLKLAEMLEMNPDETNFLQLLLNLGSTRSKEQRAIFNAQIKAFLHRKEMVDLEIEKFKLVSDSGPPHLNSRIIRSYSLLDDAIKVV